MKSYTFLIFALIFALIGCGVKGRPLPPEEPREIGIGRPQYKGLDMDLKSSEPTLKKKKDKDQ